MYELDFERVRAPGWMVGVVYDMSSSVPIGRSVYLQEQSTVNLAYPAKQTTT